MLQVWVGIALARKKRRDVAHAVPKVWPRSLEGCWVTLSAPSFVVLLLLRFFGVVYMLSSPPVPVHLPLFYKLRVV